MTSGGAGNHVVTWIRRKWLAFLSTFFQQQQHHMGLTEDVTITDERDPDTASQTGSLAGSERGIDIGRVGSWATDFEKLLTDPIGLRTFVVRSPFKN